MIARFRFALTGAVVASLAIGLAAGHPAAADRDAGSDPDEAISVKLADLLRAGRSVVSSHQDVINDPDLGDKGLAGPDLVRAAEEIYALESGSPPLDGELSDRDRRLLVALTEAMQTVLDDHQDDINRPGVGFKGFIPAVFARLTNETFGTLVGTEARMRSTAPVELVRNRRALPDDWERQVFETRFLSDGWAKGAPYTDVVEVDGRPAFRIMLPEYYSESCLVCHGGPKGEVDVTGYPKEGAAAGDLSGAISITIFK